MMQACAEHLDAISAGQVAIPAYECLKRDPGAGGRLRRLMAQLAERSFDEIDILAVYIDGIRIAGQMIVVAVGLDVATGQIA